MDWVEGELRRKLRTPGSKAAAARELMGSTGFV